MSSNAQTLTYKIPDVWNDQKFCIFVEACRYHISHKSPKTNVISLKNIAKTGAIKSRDPELFTVENCTHLANCLREYMIKILGRPKSEFDKPLERFITDNINFFPYIPPSIVLNEHDTVTMDGKMRTAVRAYMSTLSEKSSIDWNDLSKAIQLYTSFEMDTKPIFESGKETIIKQVLLVKDPLIKKLMFSSSVGFLQDIFHLIPPKSVKLSDLFSNGKHEFLRGVLKSMEETDRQEGSASANNACPRIDVPSTSSHGQERGEESKQGECSTTKAKDSVDEHKDSPTTKMKDFDAPGSESGSRRSRRKKCSTDKVKDCVDESGNGHKDSSTTEMNDVDTPQKHISPQNIADPVISNDDLVRYGLPLNVKINLKPVVLLKRVTEAEVLKWHGKRYPVKEDKRKDKHLSTVTTRRTSQRTLTKSPVVREDILQEPVQSTASCSNGVSRHRKYNYKNKSDEIKKISQEQSLLTDAVSPANSFQHERIIHTVSKPIISKQDLIRYGLPLNSRIDLDPVVMLTRLTGAEKLKWLGENYPSDSNMNVVFQRARKEPSLVTEDNLLEPVQPNGSCLKEIVEKENDDRKNKLEERKVISKKIILQPETLKPLKSVEKLKSQGEGYSSDSSMNMNQPVREDKNKDLGDCDSPREPFSDAKASVKSEEFGKDNKELPAHACHTSRSLDNQVTHSQSGLTEERSTTTCRLTVMTEDYRPPSKSPRLETSTSECSQNESHLQPSSSSPHHLP